MPFHAAWFSCPCHEDAKRRVPPEEASVRPRLWIDCGNRGNTKEQTTKQPLFVCLFVCLFVARIMPFHTQTVSHSANPPFLKVLLFCRVLLGIFLAVILHCFQSKNPTLFAKKGGKMQSFFKFFWFFPEYNSSFLISSCSHRVLVIPLFSPCSLS